MPGPRKKKQRLSRHPQHYVRAGETITRWVVNPNTGKKIVEGGPTYNTLLRQYNYSKPKVIKKRRVQKKVSWEDQYDDDSEDEEVQDEDDGDILRQPDGFESRLKVRGGKVVAPKEELEESEESESEEDDESDDEHDDQDMSDASQDMDDDDGSEEEKDEPLEDSAGESEQRKEHDATNEQGQEQSLSETEQSRLGELMEKNLPAIEKVIKKHGLDSPQLELFLQQLASKGM